MRKLLYAGAAGPVLFVAVFLAAGLPGAIRGARGSIGGPLLVGLIAVALLVAGAFTTDPVLIVALFVASQASAAQDTSGVSASDLTGLTSASRSSGAGRG
jgi:hypothetical protein